MQMGFLDTWLQWLNQWVVFIFTVQVKRHELIEENTERGTKNWEMHELQKQYIED